MSSALWLAASEPGWPEARKLAKAGASATLRFAQPPAVPVQAFSGGPPAETVQAPEPLPR